MPWQTTLFRLVHTAAGTSWGTRLFERTPRGMRLLPAGEAFLSHARHILAEVDAAVPTVRSVGADRTGR